MRSLQNVEDCLRPLYHMMLGIEKKHFQERLLNRGSEAEPLSHITDETLHDNNEQAPPWETPRTKVQQGKFCSLGVEVWSAAMFYNAKFCTRSVGL